ncbi:DNA polymerase epsilon subunit 2 [Fopius arisanus]|uniref:DNA polymerase epsilon subunit n=1 Tax=Fopius arisanus TaxID=64838 RepID=A0A9R1U7E4_9HYME|nr:PREDICTED: DNA polymerase epsilon subunit 2 [Fopius arisanus]
MADDKAIKNVQSSFSMYGFVITRPIATFVVKQLLSLPPDQRDHWLTRITDQILEQNLSDPHIALDHVKLAIKECLKPNAILDESETIFNVLNLEEIPQVLYDISMKKFVLQKVMPDYFPEPICKPNVFRNRLSLLRQRTLRQEPFAPRKFGEKSKEKKELVPVEFLLTNSREGNVYVMGILSQLVDGQYFLEDTGGAIKIDIAKTVFDEGLITEGCIVIAQGYFEDGVLDVKKIQLPPVEPSANSRASFGTENTFGGTHRTSLKCSEKLQQHQEAHNTDMIVIISELWLDNSEILRKFKVILEGYSDVPPIAFILCGHFLSSPPNVTSGKKLKDGFNHLARLIDAHPDLKKNSKFVFVPGPQDLGAAKILPRGPLPHKILEDFIKKIPGAILVGNPCRIQYCTKEIVVFREDMISKMCRNTLKYPEQGNFHDHYAKTMISQSHLAPMSLPVVPVYWKHDHVLQLFPTPDLIIVADNSQQYTTRVDDCQVINPGSFPRNNFSFKVYRPGTGEVEDCELPNDTENM